MALDQNTVIGPATIALAVYNSAGQNTYDGGPLDGMDMKIYVTQVIGNPNVFFRIEGSPDNVNWFPVAADPLGPINTVGTRDIHFSLLYAVTGYTWYRLSGYPNQLPSFLNSGNSSSLSSQTFNSSSSGGSYSLTFTAGLVVSPSN